MATNSYLRSESDEIILSTHFRIMVFNKTEKQEKAYLQQILTLLKRAISETSLSVEKQVQTLQEYKEYLWSNKDIDPHEIRSMRESILNHFAVGESIIDKRRRLERLLDIPYFGRIDFLEKGKNKVTLPIYIGIHSFYNPQEKTNLIYDWRAPVAGMFYDYELGKASYTSPTGLTEGNISIKRQYRIRKGRMEFMLESSLTVHDDVLQKELSCNADDKMKNIVATIQREQNQIIRNEEAFTLIIQGVAGSGKTSIALHRIAYLLYAYKGDIFSRDILILSPNQVFADYISGVLPELGEESVPEITMEQILSGLLGHKYKYQNFFGQVNELMNSPAAEFAERISYKSSPAFISLLNRFILHMENNYFKAVDVALSKRITIPASFIKEQFQRFNRYPMRLRFEAMTDYILERMAVLHKFTVTTTLRNFLKKEIRNMFAGNNDLQVYKDFFQWLGKTEMFKLRKNRTLEYADLAPLAYLHMALEGYTVQNRVKHLLIDEMQDYSPIQYKIIQKLYPCRKTILGDAHQSVNPYGSSTAETIRQALGKGEIMKLCKSYRSTYEITAFAQQILTDKELEPVARHGREPEIRGFKSPEEEISGINHLITNFKKSGYKSLGIICKTEAQAKEMAEKLDQVYFLSCQSTGFVQGIIVTSAHMAKGLEFDEVIIPQINKRNFSTETDRHILYVCITRAMHYLSLTYSGTLTFLIPENHLFVQRIKI